MDLGSGITVFHCCEDIYSRFFGSQEYWAIREWIEFHGVDSNRVPFDSFIYRNELDHTVICTYYSLNDEGEHQLVPETKFTLAKELHIEKGEAGPLPWPDILGEPKPVDRCGCTERCLAENHSGVLGIYNTGTHHRRNPGGQ